MISSSCRNREPLMSTSVTGALWQHFHCADFSCGSFQKLWKLFLQGEATASTAKNVTKTLHLRRTRWAAGESRALQSSCWAKSPPWHVRTILYFSQDNAEAGVWQQLRAGTEQHTGMEQVCYSSPELLYYRHCQVWQFACTLSPCLWWNMSGELSAACPHSQTLSHVWGHQWPLSWQSSQPALPGCSWALSDSTHPSLTPENNIFLPNTLRGAFPNKYTQTAAEYKPSAICLLHTQINFSTKNI